MIRVGIIGTENSHAMAFAKAINLPDPETGKLKYPDIRVTALYGPEKGPAEEVQRTAHVETIVETPEAMFEEADAMMVLSRKGSKHFEYAAPFAEKGMPLFVDKPLTADPKEARRLVELAASKGSPMCGGSGCKYAWDIRTLRHARRQLQDDGTLLSGTMNFSADVESEYDGFYFYAPHLTAMGLEVFGEDVRSVRAVQSPGGIVALWRYEQFDATLHYTRNSQASAAVLYGKDRTIMRAIDISMIYDLEVEHFVEMLRTGKMPHSYDELVRPVEIIAATLASLEENREVVL